MFQYMTGAFDCSIIYKRGNENVSIHKQAWQRWELIHLTIRLRYHGIDIIVSFTIASKVFNRLASERYFLTLEIQLI